MKNIYSKVILMHGKNTNPNKKWYPWLKNEIQKLNIEFIAPLLPKSTNPYLDEWIDTLQRTNPDKNSIIIGHSRGGVAVLRFLEQQPLNFKIKKIILVATNLSEISNQNKNLNETNHSFYTNNEYNYQKIKQHCQDFTVLHSTDDEWVPFFHGETIAQKLFAKLLIFQKSGHFGSKLKKLEIPEIINMIKHDIKKLSP